MNPIGHRSNLVWPRLPRTGLGHALTVYARAFVYHARGQAEFVHPNWFKIRIGPYLRREADKRNYHRIIRTPQSWGLPCRHALRQLWMDKVSEASFDPTRDSQFLVVKDEGPLHPLTLNSYPFAAPYRDQLREAFASMTIVPPKPRAQSPTIGVFHRSGDFRGMQPDSDDPRVLRTHGYGYYPPEYAADALAKLREIAGWNVPAVLSTDADLQEVACILEQGNVEVSRTRSALANMLEMSQHDVLVMGTSAYAKWSWFLGDALAVTPKYRDREINLIHVPERRYAWFVFGHETSLNDSQLGSEFADRLRRR